MGSVDYFLKIDGIEGESEDDKHAKEIDILSWSWGETNSGSSAFGGGGGAGKVSMQDFNFVMNNNRASPYLLLACANGKHIKEALLTCRKSGEDKQEFMKIKFTDLLISSYQTGGGGGEVIPTEQISFNYSKIEYEYKPQKEDGSLGSAIKAGWDLKKNVKI